MKIVNILPRRAGKTSKLINLFINNVEGTFILVPSDRYKHDLKREIVRNTNNTIHPDILRQRIITPRQTDTCFIGSIVSTILIDEMFFIDTNEFVRFRENLQNIPNENLNIIAFSTAKEQYPMDLINVLTEHKSVGGQLDNELYEDLIEYDEYLIKMLYYSFITDLDCTIVIGPGTTNHLDSPNYEVESLNLPFK